MILNYTVKKDDKYKTVREILRNEFKISSRLLTTLRKNKCTYLNNNCTCFDKEVNIGDLITVDLNYEEDNSNIIPNENIPLDIIYEDDSLLIINKQANIAIHPSLMHYDTSISSAVRFYFDSIGLKKKIRPVNRLDKDTSRPYYLC